MKRDCEALAKTKFDLAVIGGGINGAATAREAALRGLKVALIEARDFAAGTSSRSSKLIHGGLRYLAQYDFALVREARRERRLLSKLAPHLTRPVAFLLPIYKGDPYSPLKIRLGLALYDLFGKLGAGDRHHMLSRAQALQRVPRLRQEGLRAGAVYFDSETDDARLTLENALGAAATGATVVNYAEVRAFSSSPGARGPEIISAEVVDRLSGRAYEISARFWVNAAGPWVDHVRTLVAGYDGTRTVRLTKGTHIIVPAVAGPFALFASILPGDRIFVMAPWHNHALLGTTDTDFEGDPASVRPERLEIEYLLAALNRVLAQPVERREVLGSFAGLRALALEPGRSPSENTREYRFHYDPWAKNLITVCGGKLTTARALGEKLVDAVLERLGAEAAAVRNARPSRHTTLPGGATGVLDVFVNYLAWDAVRSYNLPYAVAERVVRTYGSRAREVFALLDEDKAFADLLPGSPALLAAEVEFAIRDEMATSVEDFLLRRSGLNWLAAATLREAAPAVARIFARHYGWSAEQAQKAAQSFSEQCHQL